MFKMVFAIELVFMYLVVVLWEHTLIAHTVTQRYWSPVKQILCRSFLSNELFNVYFWGISKRALSNH